VEQNPNEKVRKIAEEALERLSAELETGKSEALKNYLGAMGRFHRYSWGNVMLINSQRPDATHVAGFHAWHDLERSVKKGEKGIMILAPMIVKRKEITPAKEVAKPDEVFRLTGFRTAYVFDVSQTEGKPLPEFAKTTGDPKEYSDKLKALVAGRGISVEYDASIAPALGVSSGGRIRLAPGLAPAEEFSVLAHELAHEMLHHRKDAPMPPKIVRETQAEAVAFVVCRGVGLETNTAAADYIALYNGDKKTLAESLAVIQKASAEILDDLMPEKRISSLEQRPSNAATHTPGAADARAQPEAPTSENPASPVQEPVVWDR
jgi:N-terminal domain of anti-restriction factor ArdC